MTQVTPPGWYPDPGQTSDGPATERWWDGRAWTDRIRPVDPAASWGPPAQPPAAGAEAGAPFAVPPYPAARPAPARRGVRTGLAVAAAVVVLAGIGGGVYVLTAHDGRGATGSQGPGGRGGFGGPEGQGGPGDRGGPFGDRGGSGGPGGSGQPQAEDGYVADPVNGISIPVPDGWSGTSIGVGAQITSQDTYKCPGEASKVCTTGGAYSAPARAQGLRAATAEAAAKEDIAKNAEESYGGTSYGKITSHEVLASRAVTVAGQRGYMVRWKAVTSKGADGCVESLVFPSPADSRRLVVVRFGIDIGPDAPRQSVLDQITKGIKVSAGGNGRSA